MDTSPLITKLWIGLHTPLTQFNIIPLDVLEQAIIFWAVWILLNKFFFQSFAKVYEKRGSKTVKAIEDAKLLNKESEALEDDLREKIKQSTEAGNKLRLSYVEEAKKRRDEAFEKANKDMQEHLKSMIAQIEKEKTDLLVKLEEGIKQFIPLIAKKMMLK